MVRFLEPIAYYAGALGICAAVTMILFAPVNDPGWAMLTGIAFGSGVPFMLAVLANVPSIIIASFRNS